jgi:dolichol-phosphate mannosyltransferase
MSDPILSIVVPVFKEGEAVDPVLRAMTASVATPHEILVVYDFDEDPTVPVIQRLSTELPTIRGLRNDLGRGVLNAMKAGIAGSVGPYVLISMSDGSDEPHIVDSMVRLAEAGADVVAASRYMRGGHQVGGPLLKRLMSRTAGLTLHWFAGIATHDPTNNFKLYARRFLDSTTIQSTAGFELALELTVKASLAGRTVAEVPTTWRDRTAGKSNFKLRQWLPNYLYWYRVAFRGHWFGRRRSGETDHDTGPEPG